MQLQSDLRKTQDKLKNHKTSRDQFQINRSRQEQQATITEKKAGTRTLSQSNKIIRTSTSSERDGQYCRTGNADKIVQSSQLDKGKQAEKYRHEIKAVRDRGDDQETVLVRRESFCLEQLRREIQGAQGLRDAFTFEFIKPVGVNTKSN